MSTPMRSATVLRKPIRSNVRKVKAHAIKIPYTHEDPEDAEKISRIFVYVTPLGNAVHTPCTAQAYRRSAGKRFQKKKHSRMANSFNDHFFVLHDKTSKQVVGVDAFPSKLYPKKGSAPVFRQTDGPIKVKVDLKSGDLDFVDIPPGTLNTVPEIQEVMSALDKLESVSQGDKLGKCIVTSIVSNVLHLEMDGDAEIGDDED